MTAHNPAGFQRLKIHYTGATGNHAVILHMPDAAVSTDWIALYNAFTGAFKSVIDTTYAFTGCDYAAKNSNVFNPITVSTVQGTNVTGKNTALKAQMLSWTGKCLSGTRARVSIFSDTSYTTLNYRAATPLITALQTPTTWLQTLPANLCSISGETVNWHGYVNIDSNEHYVERLRR